MEGSGYSTLIIKMNAIGIDLSGSSWKAAHLKKGLSGIIPVKHFNLEGQISERLETLNAYMKKHRLAREIALALPPGDCLVKVLSLPSADRKALSGMVGYEIERHLPTEASGWRWSHTVIKTEGASAVIMLSAVKAEQADSVIAMFESAGFTASFVTSGQEALAKAVRVSGFLSASDLSAVACVGSGGFTLDFFKDGHLVYSSQSPLAMARQEIGFAMSFLTELPQDFIVIDEDGSKEAAEAIESEARQVCGTVKVLGQVPAFSRAHGAALMLFDNSARNASLLAMSDGADLRVKVLGVGAAALLALFAAGAFMTVNDALTIRKTEREIALLGDGRIKAQAVVREVDSITSDLKALEDMKGASSPGFLDMLRRLTELTPEDTYLTGLEYGKEAIAVDGVSQKASGLFMKLSRSGLAEELKYDGPVVRGQDGRERFKIKFKPSKGQGNADDRLDS